jgi:hypothetical protein
MDNTLRQRIAEVIAKREAQYGTQWDANGIDKEARRHDYDGWKLATCTLEVKNKWKEVLVRVGETVLYDPLSFRRYPEHMRPRYRKTVYVTIYAERGLTAIGCNTSVRADHFDFGTEPVNVFDVNERGEML